MKPQVKKVLVWVLGTVAAAIIGVFITEWYTDLKEARKVVSRMLAQAAKDRDELTDSSLWAAAAIYTSVLSRADSRQDSSGALVGLARTYADLAILRFWRGLSNAGYPARALEYARHAPRFDRDSTAAGIALAYAYASDEVASDAKSKTRTQVGELLEGKVDNLDTRYLAWLSGVDEASDMFPYRVQIDSLSDLLILLDVASYLVDIAEQRPAARMTDTVRRAEALLERAATIQPHNPFVLAVQAYLSTIRRNAEEAKTFYEEALRQLPVFPRAQNNLGVLYAEHAQFKEARTHFDAAARTLDAPVGGQRIWFHNLGTVDFELGDYGAACDVWRQAVALPGSSEVWLSAYGMALCHYAQGHHKMATDRFRQAANVAFRDGLDLSNIATFQELRAGPRELAADRALIQLVR